MSPDEAILQAFDRARLGDVQALRDLTVVRWCFRDIARFDEPLGLEATLTAGGPKTHTLSVHAGWGLASSRANLQQVLRLPGTPSASAERVAMWALPVGLSHRSWDSRIPDGTWAEARPASDGIEEVRREILAQIRVTWEASDGSEPAVQLDYALRRTVRFVAEWPSDYPPAVAVDWSDQPVQVAATMGSEPDQAIVRIDLGRDLGVPVAWKVTVATDSNEKLATRDVALKGTEDGLSFPIAIRRPLNALRVNLRPSLEVARASTCIDRYANYELDALVTIEPIR